VQLKDLPNASKVTIRNLTLFHNTQSHTKKTNSISQYTIKMSLYLVARRGRCTTANGRDGVEVATAWRARRRACEGVEGATAANRTARGASRGATAANRAGAAAQPRRGEGVGGRPRHGEVEGGGRGGGETGGEGAVAATVSERVRVK
jgi:hypothetical protein